MYDTTVCNEYVDLMPSQLTRVPQDRSVHDTTVCNEYADLVPSQLTRVPQDRSVHEYNSVL